MAIQPKPLNETETVSVRFPKVLLDQLDGYCKYLGGASDRSYVIVEAVREVVGRDKNFQKSLRKTEPAERPAAAAPHAADKDKKPPVTPVAPAKERAV